MTHPYPHRPPQQLQASHLSDSSSSSRKRKRPRGDDGDDEDEAPDLNDPLLAIFGEVAQSTTDDELARAQPPPPPPAKRARRPPPTRKRRAPAPGPHPDEPDGEWGAASASASAAVAAEAGGEAPPAAAAAAAAAAAEAAEEACPVPMEELNWADYRQDEKDPITDPEFCLWCDFAACAQQAKTGNKKWDKLKRYSDENWGRVHAFKFARTSQRIYNKRIREHLTDHRGRPVVGPAWPAQQIYEHATKHVFKAACAHTENAFTYQTALRRMRDHGLFLSDGSVDPKLLKVFTDTEKQARILFNLVDASKGPGLHGF